MSVLNNTIFSPGATPMFINVRLFVTIQFVTRFLMENNINTQLAIGLFELLRRCTFNVHFLVSDSIYRQENGIAMESVWVTV